MSLDTIPSGVTVLIDANIPIYAYAGQSPECGRLLERCTRGEVRGVLPAHVLAEVSHKLMSLEARAKSGVERPHSHRALLEKPSEVMKLEGYAQAVRGLLASGLVIEPLRGEDFPPALEFQSRWGLLTNDALLLAVGSRLSLNILASADKALRAGSRWKIFAPSDLKH
jgi:predicted nucleic acid-binding protein